MKIEIPRDASALPVPRRKRRRKQRSDRPMSQAERDAFQFDAIKAEFDWSNEDWALAWLPWVRTAACVVGGDRETTVGLMRDLIPVGEAPELLEGLTRTKLHLEALHKLLDAALGRLFLASEQLGYSPDNPLPETRAN